MSASYKRKQEQQAQNGCGKEKRNYVQVKEAEIEYLETESVADSINTLVLIVVSRYDL
jgi:hypothetical protein